MAGFNTNDSDACWEWLRGRNNRGYGYAQFNGKVQGVHRISWQLHHGDIPRGMSVLHKCDNPCCGNPDHLFLGTAKDNMADMRRKGRDRTPKGSEHSHAKIDEADALLIREDCSPVSLLSEMYGLSESAIRAIKSRQSWKHV